MIVEKINNKNIIDEKKLWNARLFQSISMKFGRNFSAQLDCGNSKIVENSKIEDLFHHNRSGFTDVSKTRITSHFSSMELWGKHKQTCLCHHNPRCPSSYINIPALQAKRKATEEGKTCGTSLVNIVFMLWSMVIEIFHQ